MTLAESARQLTQRCTGLEHDLSTPENLEAALVDLHELTHQVSAFAADLCLEASRHGLSQKRIAVLTGIPERSLQGLAREARGQT
jgi:glycyl-tRNA synthetase beta subunit